MPGRDAREEHRHRDVIVSALVHFGAVRTRFESRAIGVTLLTAGAVVFVAAAVITATFPVEF